ncbi:MAG TPA: excinuclease ABC subunit UvrB [Candidatus Ratteibacteria bacterium]|nr:excinuclease ABC subunit UvrB [bacterium]HPC28837.1 excinuclease ABC subunit UvrB [bacterium]HRS06403.1 excinuclease ABC subunit UvrB [Candidatus Ratteibacteria bacterium]HRV04577.1 excinuclease ABC subunit UvrB [Candidatus Ratteibacteria bacterium]
MERKFNLISHFKPSGDQPQAINALVNNLNNGAKWQVLLGVTGSGKTFTMANVIERLQRPALVISHNKTLAAQLYSEFRQFFPENKVRYFVSYYDYYQPEAYIPATDTYIEKDASINEDIDRLRLAATSAILSSRDVIVIASVSSIYPLGSPEDHKHLMLNLYVNQKIGRTDILRRFVEIQYERNDFDLERGKFRVRGNIIELIPSYEEIGVRIVLGPQEISTLERFDPFTGKTISEEQQISIYPAKHFVSPPDKLERALKTIREELEIELEKFRKQGKLLEAERLETRTKNDIEMLADLGYCHGIENYSRHLAGRLPGERPECLIDYFPDDYLLFLDESHMTIPQIRGMHAGDRSRKETLVQYGFRLPSALDNRPLTFEEFENMINQVICVSATPGPYELEKIGVRKLGEKSLFLVQQVIRPTGLVDPPINVLPTMNQLDDLVERIHERIRKNQRVLVLTISKQLAEQLNDYLKDLQIKVMYLHYEIDTLERMEILKKLREATFDVLVGINLLREGLDLPEVSLVAILDADKEGFLRSERSLIQIAGRASRSIDGEVIMYADRMTDSMKSAIEETERRRKIQQEYNQKNNIIPRPVTKPIYQTIGDIIGSKKKKEQELLVLEEENYYGKNLSRVLRTLEKKMMVSAKQLDFETAIQYREKIKRLKNEK